MRFAINKLEIGMTADRSFGVSQSVSVERMISNMLDFLSQINENFSDF
jgi:hypothetical protein